MANHIKYPLDNWFSSKKPVVLVRGVDYTSMTHSMLAYLRNSASRKNVRVSLRVDQINGKETITITNVKD
jgi:hypothetical protein